MKLSRKILNTLKDDRKTKLAICLETGISESTINRWVKNNHKNLTTENVLRVIERETAQNRNQFLIA